MNYLGHIYFSGHDKELMQANLFGDFVKGKDLSRFPETLQKGIRLHREIDDFIDHFHAVKELLVVLREEMPKVAGIAVDIFFDHLLAREWNSFHKLELPAFLDKTYASFDLKSTEYPEEFLAFLRAMVHHNWMSHYPTLYGLDRMSRGVSSKLSFPNQLIHGKAVFLEHEKAVTSAFFEYMHAAAEHFSIENQSNLP